MRLQQRSPLEVFLILVLTAVFGLLTRSMIEPHAPKTDWTVVLVDREHERDSMLKDVREILPVRAEREIAYQRLTRAFFENVRLKRALRERER